MRKTITLIFALLLLISLPAALAAPPGGTMRVNDLADCPANATCTDSSGNMKAPGTSTVGTSNSTEASTGGGLNANIENDASQILTGAAVTARLTDDTDGTEDSNLVLKSLVAGILQTVDVVVINTTLADGAQLILPGGAGIGFVTVKDDNEYVNFSFTSAGAVTTQDTAGSISTTEDNDTTLNIFDDGSTIGVENELGSSKTVVGFVIMDAN